MKRHLYVSSNQWLGNVDMNIVLCMQNMIKYTIWFKRYEHFHLLVRDVGTDSHSDSSAGPRGVQLPHLWSDDRQTGVSYGSVGLFRACHPADSCTIQSISTPSVKLYLKGFCC